MTGAPIVFPGNPKSGHCACGCGVFRRDGAAGGYRCAECGAARVSAAKAGVCACRCGSILFVVGETGIVCGNCSRAIPFEALPGGVGETA